MKYMGSKSRVAKYIVPILQRCIDENVVTEYYEPFCGGCNVIDKISCDMRYANDINKYLIGLFIHLQYGGELLSEVTRKYYSKVRSEYKTVYYEPWEVGNVGFLASYNGRFFDGGYAPAGYEKTKTGERYRDYYREACDNILAQMPKLADVEFTCNTYSDIVPKNAVVYCDPPYCGTKTYMTAKDFDFDKFWGVVREWSRDNYVFVSEENAPDDFECIWEQSCTRSINAGNKQKAVEKLYVYKKGRYVNE